MDEEDGEWERGVGEGGGWRVGEELRRLRWLVKTDFKRGARGEDKGSKKWRWRRKKERFGEQQLEKECARRRRRGTSSAAPRQDENRPARLRTIRTWEKGGDRYSRELGPVPNRIQTFELVKPNMIGQPLIHSTPFQKLLAHTKN